MSDETLTSWGAYPHFPQSGHMCTWRSRLAENFADVVARHGTTLPFGKGRSYGDSCLAASDHVLSLRRLDRLISADWQTGTIVAEAGMTLADVLKVAIPRGWFLPVTPGTKFVTLGGAVANDVHGKNHHVRGTFGRHVRTFGLLRSDRGQVVCSANDDADLYAATIGGLGLTGIIEWVELQLIPIRSSQLTVTTVRFNTLDDFFALSDELDGKNEYTVAWIDGFARGASKGRGVFTAANHADTGDLSVAAGKNLAVPFHLPVLAAGGALPRLFNSLYFHKHAAHRRVDPTGYEPFFYPLDGIGHWNRLYGRHGFQQFQCVIPHKTAQPALQHILETTARSGGGSCLSVLKRCGDLASPGLMSFPMPGISLAMDFPQTNTLDKVVFPQLDSIVREAGGRLYPAKDAHMTAEDFRRFYPAWSRVEATRDPALCSRFWKRVTA